MDAISANCWPLGKFVVITLTALRGRFEFIKGVHVAQAAAVPIPDRARAEFVTRSAALPAGPCGRTRSPHPPRVVWAGLAHLSGRR
jgi:hypothetical protein